MRINYQKKNRIEYDSVMRIRPDWKLKKNPLDQFFKRKNKIIFFDSSTIKTKKKCYASVTDVCFVSKSKEMNIVSNLYSSWIKEIKKRGWIEYSFGAKVHNYKLIFETTLFWFLKRKKIKILTNTLGGYDFVYRSSYDNRYLKRVFSMKLLLIQIKEMPKKIFNSIF